MPILLDWGVNGGQNELDHADVGDLPLSLAGRMAHLRLILGATVEEPITIYPDNDGPVRAWLRQAPD